MSSLEKYIEKYDIGFPIFNQLFQLKRDDFLKVMKDIFQDNKTILDVLENNPNIKKTIMNDTPEDIKISFYDSIEVNYLGVKYKPEHGSSSLILKFDKFFNIDVALKELST